MRTLRHILAIAMAAAALYLVALPSIACVMPQDPAPAEHRCCPPKDIVQSSQGSGAHSCCVSAPHEDPSIASQVFQLLPGLQSALLSVGAPAAADQSITSTLTTSSPDFAGSGSSILRV